EGKGGGLVETEGQVDGVDGLSGRAADEVVQCNDDEDGLGAFVDGELDLRDVRPGGCRGLRPLTVRKDADEGFVSIGLVEGGGELLLEYRGVEQTFSGPRCRFTGVGGD